MMNMWRITYDWLDKKKINIQSANFDQKKWDELPKEEKTKIKLYDDDDNLYYDGETSWINAGESKAFQPLDWAAGYAGCTYMKYKDKDGEWKVL
jgi:hypothetical protein